MPELFSIYDKYHDQGLAIIEIRLDRSLGIDSDAKINEKIAEVKKPFWNDRDLPIPIALVHENQLNVQKDANGKNANVDAPSPLMKYYGLNGIPTGVLIDRQGRVVGRFDPRGDTVDAMLEKVIKEK
jgi:hypothetical protein